MDLHHASRRSERHEKSRNGWNKVVGRSTAPPTDPQPERLSQYAALHTILPSSLPTLQNGDQHPKSSQIAQKKPSKIKLKREKEEGYEHRWFKEKAMSARCCEVVACVGL